MIDAKTCDTIYSNNGMSLLRIAAQESEKPEDFFLRVEDINSDQVNLMPYSHNIELFKPLINGEKDNPENAITMYEAVGPIDRVNAADPRLWTYLALNTCREFMISRWPLKESQKESWKNRLRSRWLMPENPSRSNLTRHGIARLWWIAELTYDGALIHKLSGRENDPYAYTKWMFENQDRIVAITERNFGANDSLRWALMDSMADDARTNKGEAIKTASKDLRLELSFRNLNVLGDEVAQVVDDICHPDAGEAEK